MDKKQAQALIKETFESSFNKNRFIGFAKNLLNDVEEAPFVYRGNFIPDAYEQYINTLERIGKYSDGEHKIDILIAKLKKETSIERARTMQRNFVAWYLNGSRGGEFKDAALVAFVAPNKEDWRFSLVKMDYRFEEGKKGRMRVKEEFTPARRWSFLVGTNEKSHTAQSQLVDLIADDERNPVVAQLEEAFNIEKVTKEFFEKYRELFLLTKDTLEDVVKRDRKIREDFKTKGVNTVDFSKKLLGQIVFLYFLQKKGWFGVKRDADWGTGPKNFLRELFEKKHGTYNNFFNDILEPLFYEALARERDGDFYSRFNCKIPFLNGGLFDPINDYDWVHTDILLPNDLFSNSYKTKEGDKGNGILDIFDRYNFTVKEDEPLEKEVAVDPEMLGKVFENLLEVKDRKSKGTYYTPREIVHYMCVQSLVNYLATELEGKVTKADCEKLIKYGESVGENEARVEAMGKETQTYYYKLPESIRANAKLIDKKLADIKICDPAIGSGAFPVGIMTEIVRSRNTLSSYIKDHNRTPYNFKRDCIHNSLYGVDIDPGAVEIAKLRLWLSLVVDEEDIKQIKPLPNLEYKIMQGNSLLEEFEGVRLFDERIIAPVDFDKEKQIADLKERQSNLSSEYIRLHQANKLTQAQKIQINDDLKKISSQIRRLEQSGKKVEENASLFDMFSNAKKKSDDLKQLHKEFFETTQKTKKDDLKRQIERLEWDLIEVTLKEQGKQSELKKLEEFKQSNIKPFFLWRLNFPDVFQDKGGFDVVIANPPYDVYQGHRKDEIDELSKIDIYAYAKGGKLNAYKVFLCKSLEIQKTNGILCEIFQNSFLADNSAKNIRKFFLNNQQVMNIDSFPERDDVHRRVFEYVKMSVCILLSNNRYLDDYSFTLNIWRDKYMSSAIKTTFRKKELAKYDPENLTIPSASEKEINILRKVADFPKLNEIARCYEGEINLTFHKKFLRSKKSDNSLMIKGAAVQKWHLRGKMSQGEIEYLDKSSYLKENSGKKSFHFKQSRIVMQGITGVDEKYRLKMTIIEENVFCGNSVNYILILDDNYSQEYILSIMNSKLMNWYFKIFSTNSNVNGYEVNNFPIPKIDKREQKPFDEIVDKIFSITKSADYLTNSSKQAKVKEYERQIDQMVYKLYGLTDNEIKIIGNSID